MRYAIATLLLLWTVASEAQTPSAPPTEDARFDVTSVKPLPEGMVPGGSPRYTPTRFSVAMTASQLIQWAYQVRENQIVGGPEWLKKVGYDINATLSRPMQIGDLPSMFRHLLEDRFHLKAHRERRTLPAYALVIARKDGKLGPGLLRADRPCTTEQMLNARSGFGTEPRCASLTDWSEIVEFIRSLAERPVVDRTGLTGQFKVDWFVDPGRDPDDSTNRQRFDELMSRPITLSVESLGLKLEARSEPLDVVVVDSVEVATTD
jgi:uncharacterized protein (TIGR03435 family)